MEQYLISLLTFCLGTLVGHRLPLWRERRKEFNEIAIPIRITLTKQIREMETGQFPRSQVNGDQWALLAVQLGERKAKSLHALVEAHQEAQRNSGHTAPDGSWALDDFSECLRLSRKLLSYVRPR